MQEKKVVYFPVKKKPRKIKYVKKATFLSAFASTIAVGVCISVHKRDNANRLVNVPLIATKVRLSY